jgi:hypothetical protein
MRERDELPARISMSKQALLNWGERRRFRVTDHERLWARVTRFLRRQVGRRWADVWPEADALLRKGHEHPEIVARVRRDLLDFRPSDWALCRSGGANLRIVDGVLIAEKPRRHRGVTVAPTFSAAELMSHPELIEG